MSTTTLILLQTGLLTAVWFLMGKREPPVFRRMKRYIVKSQITTGKAKGGNRPSFYQAIDNKMERVPIVKVLFNHIEQNLSMANIPVKTSEFLIAVLILIVTAQVVEFFIVGGYHYSSPLVLAASLIFSFGFLKVYIRLRIGRIRKQLKLAISMMANNLKAGHSFIQAMRQVCTDLAQPLKGEFEILMNENRLGIPLDVALNNMLKRVPCKELETLVRGVILQQETGSNLVFILNTICQTLQDRDELRSKIDVLTVQGKISGVLCVCIPFLLFWYIHVSQPDYTEVLLHTQMGQTLLALCGFMIFLGTFCIIKIVSFKF